jgi:hypothetical protein
MGRKTTEKHSFYNPIWQNKTHINSLRKYIKTTAPFYSVVVFSNRGELKSVTYDGTKVKIFTVDQLRAYMRVVRNEYPDVLSTDEVDSIVEKVLPLAGVDPSVKQ